MTDLIEDLLTYSKTHPTLESFDSVNLNEIVEEIIQLHKEEFDQKKVKFQIGLLPIMPRFISNETVNVQPDQ